MNERIQELIKQTSTVEVIRGRGFDETQYINRFDKEKFAELIVQECANMVNSLEQHKGPGDCTTAEYIKDYFGVK